MRILLVVHGFPPAASGGTEVYARDLASALAAAPGDQVRVLTRDNDPARPDLHVRTAVDGEVRVVAVNNTFQSCGSFEESYTNPGIERIAGDVLDDWGPDVVHAQHLTCLSTGIPRQAAIRGIPVVLTLNDYWLICHRGQLVDRDGRRCAGPFQNGCAGCLSPGALAGPATFRAGRFLRALPIPGAGQVVRLATRVADAATSEARVRAATLARLRHMQAAMRDVDLFLAPSRTLADTFVPFGFPEDRIVACNQGIALRSLEPGRRVESAVLRLGFAGGLLPTKGAHVLLDALQQLPEGTVVVDFLGAAGAYHGEDSYARSLEARLGHPAIRRRGPVPHERMADIFQDLDVLVLPSIWIENAPFVIREAFAAGAPVVASDLGGMAEMVRDGVDGLLFAAGDSRALAAALGRLIDEPGLLETLRRGIVRPMSIEADAAFLRGIYARLPRRAKPAPAPAPVASHGRSPKVAAVILNYRTPEQTWLAARSLQTSRPGPTDIVVVDNASGDGSAARLRRTLDRVRVIESPDNLGFSGGCNIGIGAALDAGADFILLLNSDAVLAPGALGMMLDAMRADPSLGIAAPVLLSREEPDHISSAGISFSARTGRMRHRLAGRRASALGTDPCAIVDAVSGGAMLIRTAVFEAAGRLDEAYFFSFEDIDFCLRARDAGFRTACVQSAFAYHEGGRTIGRRSARRVYFATRNHLRLAARRSVGSHRTLQAGLVVGLNAAYVLASPEAPLFRGASALVRGAWHHFTGRYGAD